MKKLIVPTLMLCAIFLGSCNVQQAANAPPDKSVSDDPIEPDPRSDTLPCLGPKARAAWNVRPGLNALASPNILEGLAKNMLDQATAPAVAGATMLGTTSTHTLNATGPLMNAARGKGPDAPMPLCGNWCGPDHPKDISKNPPAVDQLDSACRQHDKCYAEFGYYSCACDQALVDEVVKGRTLFDLNPNEQKIVVLFRGSACFGGCKVFEGHQVCGGRYIPALGIKRQM